MKRLLFSAVCLMLCLSLCACSGEKLFEIGFNRVTAEDILWTAKISDDVYSYELYQNSVLPLKHYGPGIYYYFKPDYDDATPPILSVIDPYRGNVRTLCTDSQCYHNSLSYTRRCILCDIYDTSRITTLGGYIFYARADKSYYDEKSGSVSYKINHPDSPDDEVEFEYTLIQYDPATGKYNELYKVEPGGYIDHITGHNIYIYFYETAYELIPQQEFSYKWLEQQPDGRITGTYAFTDNETGALVYYDATLFFEHDTFTGKLYNIKQNRRMLLRDNRPNRKIYKLQRLNIKNRKIETLATRDSLPKEFHIFDRRIYELLDDGLFSYDLDYRIEYVSTSQPGEIRILGADYAAGARLLQYDQFTKNIYFIKNGMLMKVKAAGEPFRGVLTVDLRAGAIVWYQLWFDGVYFMTTDGEKNSGIRFVRYLDINKENAPFETVFDLPGDMKKDGGFISYAAVLDDYIYFLHTSYVEYVWPDGHTELTVLTKGPYRYSFKMQEIEKIWPEGWKLGK